MIMPETFRSDQKSSISLQRLPAPRLDGQNEHAKESGEEQTASGVDWRRRVAVASLASNNGRTQAEETVEEARDTSSGTADGRREYLGSVRVKDTIHDVLEKCFKRRVDELGVGVLGSRKEADQDAGDDGCKGHRAFAADVLQVYGVAGQEGAGHADGGGDGVVAVLDRGRGVAATEVLGQEGVEEGVAHSDGGPDEPEEDGGHGEAAAVEQGPDVVAGELAQIALDDLHGGELLVDDFGVAADLVEDVFGEPGLALVEVGDSVDDRDGFGLSAAREEELGRLEQVEEEEAADEHEEGDAADDVNEVAPAHFGREVYDASPGDCEMLACLQRSCFWQKAHTERGD
jgi:hypothetical protein